MTNVQPFKQENQWSNLYKQNQQETTINQTNKRQPPKNRFLFKDMCIYKGDTHTNSDK